MANKLTPLLYIPAQKTTFGKYNISQKILKSRHVWIKLHENNSIAHKSVLSLCDKTETLNL
ncbi:hypothetical protein HMPREF1991_02072 [Hoylesella loescheii DSM 19665 = JCM 12249 = ATCC 15930]|uniref:Uncharacterized protein n=1 Tax=Hoylesella loescheii DSM 19665 = JCM 12249 = ATCC 15930 TaxID=1122985 RepID=A0A069QPS6_HOYLO|nr:hypothetical protein HMPREF1991_02072 [Hoylesella loescheii DSM 19665 = JCM 12249 = ATCC 15930]